MRDFLDAGHGYDEFGLAAAAVDRAARLGAPLYERYFRVDSRGAERLPADGPALLIANHGGTLPVDAAVLWLDVLRRTGRVLRLVADRFVPRLPWVGVALARCGVVPGTLQDLDRLLARGALVAIFPEGVTGTGKRFADRYHLQAWRLGHAELARRHRAPVVPVAIVGAEEAWPVAVRLPLHVFGAPYLPVPATPLPLPVRLRLRYGAALALHALPPGPDLDDEPAALEAAARRTRAALQQLLEDTLAERRAAHHPAGRARRGAAR